jgi:hypothetical protein
MSGSNGTHKSNGHGRDGHTKAATANGVNRLTGDEATPLGPSATAATPTAPPPAPAPGQPRAEGRDSSSGRFTAGNRYGRGNPHARRMAALREAFLSAATGERMRELGEKLLAAALAGDWQAAKLLLPFVLGRPADAVDPDTLDLDEWRLRQDCPRLGDVVEAAGKLVIERAFIMLQKLDPGAWHTAGATIIPLCDLLSEAAQQGAEPATGPPPAP